MRGKAACLCIYLELGLLAVAIKRCKHHPRPGAGGWIGSAGPFARRWFDWGVGLCWTPGETHHTLHLEQQDQGWARQQTCISLLKNDGGAFFSQELLKTQLDTNLASTQEKDIERIYRLIRNYLS